MTRPRCAGGEAGGSALEAALAAIEHDAVEHLTSGPANAEDLRRLEEKLGLPLPAAFRRFLERLGGGLFYQRHEVFGAHRVLIHDIELLPDLATFCGQVEAQGAPRAHGFLPFHRVGDVVHVLDLREDGRASPPVRTLDGSKSYPDFVAFLQAMAVPRDV